MLGHHGVREEGAVLKVSRSSDPAPCPCPPAAAGRRPARWSTGRAPHLDTQSGGQLRIAHGRGAHAAPTGSVTADHVPR
ncbi:hypothetical protein QJS66_20015 [Kocuria rhizophila]|nr:hypothetical protein QJS66_20015 [Kocuria rhizophila]